MVAIDVLRATTTISCALHNGARSVLPCEEPQDARRVRERLGAACVLGGERDSVGIAGFDLDNSPASYTRERVLGRTVAFTTTNGTRALHRAMEAAPAAVLCGAFLNLRAIVEHVVALRAGSVLLACAGSEGGVALEDVLLAGAIAQRLSAGDPSVALSDAAKLAMLAYENAAGDLPAAIASSDHAQTLIRAGFAADVALAAQVDVFDVVPIVRDGEVVSARFDLSA